MAIGGGNVRTGETAALDRRIIELSGASRPRALFLPTASFDEAEYADSFARVYRSLGCRVSLAFLWEGYDRVEIEAIIQATKFNVEPHRWEFRGDPDRVRAAIADADLIYVGGGNTRRMLELWRSIGVDRWLREAGDRGCVLSGLSAGCICWGRYGNSDAALTEGMGRPTMRVDGLGFLPVSLCPHMSRESFRLEEFQTMMRQTPGIGIGLDDGAALVWEDGAARIESCLPGAGAHLVSVDGAFRWAAQSYNPWVERC